MNSVPRDINKALFELKSKLSEVYQTLDIMETTIELCHNHHSLQMQANENPQHQFNLMELYCSSLLTNFWTIDKTKAMIKESIDKTISIMCNNTAFAINRSNIEIKQMVPNSSGEITLPKPNPRPIPKNLSETSDSFFPEPRKRLCTNKDMEIYEPIDRQYILPTPPFVSENLLCSEEIKEDN